MPDKYTIIVKYPGIYTQEDADTLKLSSIIEVTYSDKINSYVQSNKEFYLNPEQLDTDIEFKKTGEAVIKLTPKQSSLTLASKQWNIAEQRNYDDLRSLKLAVSMKDFRGSQTQKTSKKEIFTFN
ncbi:hypothetical protein [Lonepinella sp. MS14435]|uniref:hypothetical protein n=1 Tax=Lonepinella sp. MS14435 TaxID=3003618 RepID=UPI0036DDD159